MFAKADRDGDGKLSKEEWFRVLNSTGYQTSMWEKAINVYLKLLEANVKLNNSLKQESLFCSNLIQLNLDCLEGNGS